MNLSLEAVTQGVMGGILLVGTIWIAINLVKERKKKREEASRRQFRAIA